MCIHLVHISQAIVVNAWRAQHNLLLDGGWPCYIASDQHTTLRHQFMEYHTFCGSIRLVLHDHTLQIRFYMQVVWGKGWLKIVVHNSLQPFIPKRSPHSK
jgi:hypothetical protein